MGKRKLVLLLVLLFFLIVLCLGFSSFSYLSQRNNCELSIILEGESSMLNETMPIGEPCSQEIPLFYVGTDNSTSNSDEPLFSKEDFASLVEGKSTIDNLLPIIGDYPVWLTSYGFWYEIDLNEGNKINILVDTQGVIFDIFYS